MLERKIGIILNRRNIGNHDRIVTFFAVDGKHEYRARGTQKLESKLAGSLEPLTLVELTVARGKRLGQITGASVRDAYDQIRQSVPRLAGAGILASALDALVRGHLDESTAYQRIREAFVLLERSRTNREVFLSVAYGLWNLLRNLGYAPAMAGVRSTPAVVRLVAVLLRGHPLLVRRIRCSVQTARLGAEAGTAFAEEMAEREISAASFFRRVMRVV